MGQTGILNKTWQCGALDVTARQREAFVMNMTAGGFPLALGHPFEMN